MRQNDFLQGYIMPSRPSVIDRNHLMNRVIKTTQRAAGPWGPPTGLCHWAREGAKGFAFNSQVFSQTFPKTICCMHSFLYLLSGEQGTQKPCRIPDNVFSGLTSTAHKSSNSIVRLMTVPGTRRQSFSLPSPSHHLTPRSPQSSSLVEYPPQYPPDLTCVSKLSILWDKLKLVLFKFCSSSRMCFL